MRTYKLHLLRHGMTQGNLEGRYVGREDIPLCKEGLEEIAQTLENYEYPYVDQVYCSPMKRARQTADLLYPKTPLTVVEDLMEISMGDFEGELMTNLLEQPPFQLWLADAQNNPPPNALEDVAQFGARIKNALHSVFADMTQNGYSEAAVVCHGGVISGLISQFGYPKEPLAKWTTGNISGYTIAMSTQMWMQMDAFEVIAKLGPDNQAHIVLESTR